MKKLQKARFLVIFLLALSLYACSSSGDSISDTECDLCSCITTAEICSPFYDPACDTSGCTACSGSGTYDSYFGEQWYLDDAIDENINVIPVWDQDIKGDKILVAVVDDSLDYTHEDLSANIIRSLNYNYLTRDSNINLYDYAEDSGHGTSVAGLIAARSNGIGIMGVAPCASLAGFNMLQASTVEEELDAMIRYKDVVSVSNNSWGPPDNGNINTSEFLWQQGIDEGVTAGRNGRGIVYVWAAGNGGLINDNTNYDGYANYYGVIAVGSVDRDGGKSYYSEEGANLWICSPANGVFTTAALGTGDFTNKNYTDTFDGTSAAAPIVSGVVALMLRANPSLSWRDVKIILARTARQNDPLGGGWVDGVEYAPGSRYHLSHLYGFGVADATAAVNMAKSGTYTKVGALKTYISLPMPGGSIPDNNAAGINSSIAVTSSGITYIEYIAITVNISHPYSGDLGITLARSAPAGASSILATPHNCYNSIGNVVPCSYFDGGASFTFGSARHLEEPANGTWTLTVRDLVAGNTGTLNSWSIKIYGH